MELNYILTDLGLTDKEAKIYLALLELNESVPGTISRKSNIKRPTTYVLLENLIKKGLVTTITRNRVTCYRAIDPKLFLETEKSKVERLESVLPELLNIHSKFGSTPQMSVFHGEKGLIEIMEDTLTTTEELLCWCDVDLAVNTILSNYFPTYLKKKLERKIWLRGIFTYNKGGLQHKKMQEKELREVYLIPKEKFPFENEINIYDDKVAIISHKDKVGVIIQNQSIADTQKAIFSLGFEYAKILEKEVLTKEDRAFLAEKHS